VTDLLTNVTPSRGLRTRRIYNGHSRASRALADWWEDHQEADRERHKTEQAREAQARLIESARAKLTAEEYEALSRSVKSC
jgi:hypothetical protein